MPNTEAEETNTISPEKFCALGKAVIQAEAEAVATLANRIDENFAKACHYLLNCTGRIIVLGIGKSGHIGSKIAATLASTGSPAFFVHPAEARHGDFGMITKEDAILGISNSGETDEIITLLPLIKWLDIPVISITGNQRSTLAKSAHVNLDVSVTEEACPLGLAPTSSTIAALAMGDALAIALLKARGFTSEDFARVHPGGILGRRLLLRIDDLMRTGDAIPTVLEQTTLSHALIEMSKKGLGMTTVVDEQKNLMGIFTDGDLRRALDRDLDIHKTIIRDVMSSHYKNILPGMLAAEALHIMEKHKITSLLVLNESNTLLGVVHMHDLLRAGLM